MATNLRTFRLLWVVLILATLINCKSRNIATEHAQVSVDTIPIAELKQNVLQFVADNDLDYKALSAKGQIDAVFNGSKISAGFDLRMQNKETIWISIRVAGLEVARALISPDSLYYLDRMKKEYYAEPYAFLEEMAKTKLPFDQLQALLIDNFQPFLSYDWKQDSVPKQYYALEADAQFFTLVDSAFVDKFLVNFIDGRQLTATYSFKERRRERKKDNPLIPNIVLFEFKNPQYQSLRLDYSKFALTDSIAFPYKVTDKYTKINR